jgi:uncharacterized protein YigA (DUF484 family)
MKADEVARYLRDNPQFFEEYADMMSQVVMPHPHGGRAISITERQILTLREKVRQLETRLADLIRFGEENDAIAEKVHRLSTALLAARGSDAALRSLHTHLVEDFAVPHVAIRLWDLPKPGDGPEYQPVAEGARSVASGLVQPYCGASQGFEMVHWFGEDAGHLRSLALVALRKGNQTIGLLVLASEDAQRFYPEMGTLYLARIGEMASVALARDLG